jgi:predicted RNA binding protein YcfA (HicA-like mRNA interferase family)
MSRREKLLAKIRNNPKGVRFEDLTKLLEWYGFELKRVKGSHYGYICGSYNLTVPKRSPHLHSYIVKDALKILDELLEEEEVDNDE